MGIGRGNGSKVVKGGVCDICNHDVACKVGFILLCDNCAHSYLTISGLSRRLQIGAPAIKKSIANNDGDILQPTLVIRKNKGVAPLWSEDVISEFIEGLELVPREDIELLLESRYDMRTIAKLLNQPFYILKLSLEVKPASELHGQAHKLLSRRNVVMKTCKTCKEKKELTEFYKAPKNIDKLCGSCKVCAKLGIYIRYHKGVREEGPRPCAICKKSSGDSTHRMKKSIICEKCNDVGYLMSGAVAGMVGVPKAGISGYLNEKKYHMVPMNDGFLNVKFAVWKPETVNTFVRNMPEICPIKIKAYINLGYTRKKMAELFDIHSYYVFKYLRENNLRTSTKGVRCMEKGSQAYNRVEHAYDAANRIMNERVSL